MYNSTIHVWITKYALTEGIIETVADNCLTTCPDGSMIGVGADLGRQHFHGEGREWHKSLESAMRRAEEMKADQIESAMRKVKRLQEQKIKVVQKTYGK